MRDRERARKALLRRELLKRYRLRKERLRRRRAKLGRVGAVPDLGRDGQPASWALQIPLVEPRDASEEPDVQKEVSPTPSALPSGFVLSIPSPEHRKDLAAPQLPRPLVRPRWPDWTDAVERMLSHHFNGHWIAGGASFIGRLR